MINLPGYIIEGNGNDIYDNNNFYRKTSAKVLAKSAS